MITMREEHRPDLPEIAPFRHQPAQHAIANILIAGTFPMDCTQKVSIAAPIRVATVSYVLDPIQ